MVTTELIPALRLHYRPGGFDCGNVYHVTRAITNRKAFPGGRV